MRNKRFMKPLTADVQLYTAKMDAKPIAIFIDQELVGRAVIERITEDSIKVKGEYFMHGFASLNAKDMSTYSEILLT